MPLSLRYSTTVLRATPARLATTPSGSTPSSDSNAAMRARAPEAVAAPATTLRGVAEAACSGGFAPSPGPVAPIGGTGSCSSKWAATTSGGAATALTGATAAGEPISPSRRSVSSSAATVVPCSRAMWRRGRRRMSARASGHQGFARAGRTWSNSERTSARAIVCRRAL